MFEKLPVEFGVPQGSDLGPLLFLVYVNDIVNSASDGNFVLFADDTNIFVVANTEREAYKNANGVLTKIEQYMSKNMLHINVGKSCYMVFTPEHGSMTCARARTYDMNKESNLYLCGTRLNRENEIKFLGAMIDDRLKWDSHIDFLERKLNSCIIIIKRIKRFIPKSEYMKIYNALSMSHLAYCISCWGGIPKYKLNKIFSILKRCIRLLFGKDWSYDHPEYYETCARTRTFAEHMSPKVYALEHTKPLFKEHNILSVEYLYKYHTFMELFKIMKHQSPVSLYCLFKPNSLYHRNISIILPSPRLEKSKINFIFKSSSIWNEFIQKILEK